MRIAITGADGQLGSELQRVLDGHTVVPLCYPDFDLLKPDVEERVLAARPELIIHAAAYTNVDKAEDEPAIALAVNAEGTARVARAAAKAKARLIYVSTDYVFDGRQRVPYEETDEPHPCNVYGRSKLEGERYVLRLCANSLVVRTSWLYGRHGANFVKTILRAAKEQPELRVVADQRGCPTHAGDLALMLAGLIRHDITGIVHAAGSGDCTWQEFAAAIVSTLGLSTLVHPISTKEAARKAPRPAYSVLADRRLGALGLSLPHWKESLARFLTDELPTAMVPEP